MDKLTGVRLSDCEINQDWLNETLKQIKAGKITIKEAAQSIKVSTILGTTGYISVSKNTFKTHLKEKYNITIFLSGRKGWHKEIEQDLAEIVTQKRERYLCGITKIWEILDTEGIQCSRADVEYIFRNVLKIPPKGPRKLKVRCRYEMSHVNVCWHGDIHYITLNNETKYLFALIDDKSRYIINYGLFDEKTTKVVYKTLKHAIAVYGAPFIFWSDNGGENVSGLISGFLEAMHIIQTTTPPKTPQANGKIEVWWKGLDKFFPLCNS